MTTPVHKPGTQKERDASDACFTGGLRTSAACIIFGTSMFLLGETMRRGFLPNASALVADLLTAALVAAILTGTMITFARHRTGLVRAKQELHTRERHYRMLFNHGTEAVFIYPLRGDGTPGFFVEVNAVAQHMLGYTREEFLRLTPGDIEISAQPAYAQPPCSKDARERVPVQTLYRGKDGRDIPVEVCQIFFQLEGRRMVMSSARDITQRREAQARADAQRAYFRQLFELSPLGIVMLDQELRVLKANSGFEKLFQYPAAQITGRHINDVLRPGHPLSPHQARQGSGVVRREAELRRKDGRPVLASVLNYPIIIDGQQVGIYGIYEDITARRKAEQQLQYLSYYDTLTGLYNRTYFEREIQRFNSEAGPVGIIVCDVDGLKLINDTLGHESGDRLLRTTADILRYTTRENGVAARIGGDEFAVLLPDRESAVADACARVRSAVQLYNAAHPKLPLSLSIGFAVRNRSRDLRHIFTKADDSMYREKLHRGKSIRNALIQTLMKALEARDFITEEHAARMDAQVTAFGKKLGLPASTINDLRLLARFHDIGKVGIPDHILFKPGPLTPDERAKMQRHCEIGYRIARASPDLLPISDWILGHHEWWNGQGYPGGLKEEEIPLACRILAIVDAFDAMTSHRPYRRAMPAAEALAELERCAGTQFDPELVGVFVQMTRPRERSIHTPGRDDKPQRGRKG